MKDFFNKETLDNIKQFCAENKKSVSYTHLDVYKRQVVSRHLR